jgi:hypothetical protein
MRTHDEPVDSRNFLTSIYAGVQTALKKGIVAVKEKS